MEVHIGLGGVYKQPPGKMIRGAFENLFLSVREALQGERRSAASLDTSSPISCSHPQPAWGESSPWSEARGTHWREPQGTQPDPPPCSPRGQASQFTLSSCTTELKEILGDQGGMPEEGNPEPASKEGYPEGISDSAKEICKAVSVSLGLSMEALEHLSTAGEGQRGDCMFAGPPHHTMDAQTCQVAEEDKSDTSSSQYREGAFRRAGQSTYSAGKAPENGSSLPTEDKEQPCTDMALPEPGGLRSRGMEIMPSLTLYKPTAFMEDTPAYSGRDYYSFQMALAPHGRIKVENPMEFTSGAWGEPSRYGALPGFPHCGPSANWHSLFEEGQSSASYPDASLYSYPRSHMPPGPDGDFPAEAWYPATAMLGRVPYGSPMKTEMTPWMEGYPGAFGEMR